MKKLLTITGWTGAILVFSAAGASDLNTISFPAMCLLGCLGMTMAIGSFWLHSKMN